MTPATFAKLGLQMLSAYMLFLALPYRLAFSAHGLWYVLTQRSTDSLAMTIFETVFFSSLYAVWLWIWFRAESLSRHFIPAGANEAISGYARWQSLGLMLIGGCMVAIAIAHMTGPGYFYSLDAIVAITVFDLAVGLVLIVGAGSLKRICLRLIGTNWLAVLMAQRAKL
ncbi:hypothetical protein [Asticcacaulis sp.]|uniref:hypothetical protein n=1 Tax=Asticcacaulis sp. TaxID=1872648 RepID=UPI002C99ADE1|nr:hypothetical protein [Asticcacaulis sp.]HTM80664.1 hypothetical protein [Asticcacaulis sp.]